MVWFVSIALVVIFIFLIKEGDERVIGSRCCRCSRLRCPPGSDAPGHLNLGSAVRGRGGNIYGGASEPGTPVVYSF